MKTNDFFRISDPQALKVDEFTIPPDWWSRGYEYHWALTQAIQDEVVVDAGCGPGHPFKNAIAEFSKHVYAVDLCTVSYNPKFKNIEVINADIRNMPIKSESIDTVYCISVLEHLKLDEIDESLKEFSRILAPNGRCVITCDIGTCVSIQKINQIFDIAHKYFKYDEYMALPDYDTVYSKTYQLYCYHIILNRR